MADKHPENEEPVIRDKRKIDPQTGEARAASSEGPPSEEGAGAAPTDDLIQAEGPDVELSEEDVALLAEAEQSLVTEYKEIAARAQAELANFRMRVERDRAANRDAVIMEVIRTLLPAIDDLDRADEHGDLTEGAPLTLVAQKLRGGFEKYGLRKVGEKGEPFDPNFHEAVAQLPSADSETETIADVILPGYALGDRLIRAARVAVAVPPPAE